MDAKSRSRALRRELEGCFFRGNLPALIIPVLCMLLLTGVNLVAAWLMQQLVDIVVSGGAGMGGILLTFAAAFAVFILAYDVQRYTCAAFVRRAVVQSKNFAFSGILERSVSFVSQENSAKFISILTNDVASIETNYLAKVFTLVMELAGFVGALGMMLFPIFTVYITDLVKNADRKRRNVRHARQGVKSAETAGMQDDSTTDSDPRP